MSSNRVQSIDGIRGISVLCMICVHTMWMYADIPTQSDTIFGHVVHFIGKGTAAFLFTMGVSLLLSRHQSMKDNVLRGVIILALGYSMNVLKFALPIEVGVMPDAFVAAYGWERPLDFAQYRYLVLTGDILQMAGFALIVLGVVMQLVKHAWQYLALAVIVAAVSRPLSGWTPGIDGLDYFFKVLWGDTYHIYFPLFPWISCILVGLFLGKRYTENKDLDKFHHECLVMGLILAPLGGGLMYWDFDYHFNNFFHLGFGGITYLIGFNLFLVWMMFKARNWWIVKVFMPLFTYCSRHVTSLYLLQWVLICWGMGIIGFRTMDQLQTLSLMPVVLLITLFSHYSFMWLKTRFTDNQQQASEAK
ncbi:heparan-alpha-glucosaminide N-acetyltransferase domain-containing protein [Veronia pacifica]|uniref:Heparan-alpha-glucosaminide N-acetyltransferase catalytic domain-containing protein n=1 Tax=Veronia pacifica TaxID=1080227 RepID=A0A1C3ESJ7_9GAMM|nr:heparan-alpha-glucosaminide N-acetyltransferase domain-containing protein [Veronia pacifica]ODA36176.1 hypothetical protein A8L45_00810 [Veronia pacifica]